MEDTNEILEKYSYLIPITLSKMYGNYHAYAKIKGLESSDLEQFSLMGMYIGLQSYEKKQLKSSLRNHLIKNIRWYVRRQIDKYGIINSYKRYAFNKTKYKNHQVTLLSMSTKFDQDDTMDFYDKVGSNNIFSFENDQVESEIISDFTCNEILSKLTEKERELVQLRIDNDYSYSEIAKQLGVTKQRIGYMFRVIQNKLSRYMENVV